MPEPATATKVVLISRHDYLDYYPWSYYNNTEVKVAGALLLLLLISLLVAFFFAYPYDGRTTEREIIYVDLEKGESKKGKKSKKDESDASDNDEVKSSAASKSAEHNLGPSSSKKTAK